MAILTMLEAAELLDYESAEDMPRKVMTVLVPAINSFIRNATGKDWSKDSEVDPVAKMCAGILLVRWFEDPGQVGKVSDAGLLAVVGQLSARAAKEGQVDG